MAASARVQQILTEVRSLSEEEQAELEAELCAEDASAGRAWGEEVDRRAARASASGERGLDRDEVRALFAMPAAEARARLVALLDARK